VLGSQRYERRGLDVLTVRLTDTHCGPAGTICRTIFVTCSPSAHTNPLFKSTFATIDCWLAHGVVVKVSSQLTTPSSRISRINQPFGLAKGWRAHAQMTIKMRKRALQYAERGRRVVPMYPVQADCCGCSKGKNCTRPGKHPMTKHGVKDATTDPDQIKAWWTDWPKANIGIAPGGNAGILVLDIDPRNDGNKTLGRLEKKLGPLPDTVTALTGGGGRHLVFQHPPFRVRKDNTGKGFGPGIDVLSDGSIMIAPPSLHITGKRYRWLAAKSLRDLPPAALPQAWQDRLRRNSPLDANADSESAVEADGVAHEGQRNNHLTSFAGKLQRIGASPKTLRAAVEAESAPSGSAR
jgi:putative DNA primase/helicase